MMEEAGMDEAFRSEIVRLARLWIGTPYHHQASVRGVGSDCLGLVRGIYRELHGHEPESLPAYTPDWAERMGAETMAEAARRHLEEKEPADAQAGDVVLFRMKENGPAKHAAVLSSNDRMIHAWSGHAVAETGFDASWRRRMAFAFAFCVQGK